MLLYVVNMKVDLQKDFPMSKYTKHFTQYLSICLILLFQRFKNSIPWRKLWKVLTDVEIRLALYHVGEVMLVPITSILNLAIKYSDSQKSYRDKSIQDSSPSLTRYVQALQCLHQLNILHCDVKPLNMLVTLSEGADLQVSRAVAIWRMCVCV